MIAVGSPLSCSCWPSSVDLAVSFLRGPIAARATLVVMLANSIEEKLDVAGHRVVLDERTLIRVVPWYNL